MCCQSVVMCSFFLICSSTQNSVGFTFTLRSMKGQGETKKTACKIEHIEMQKQKLALYVFHMKCGIFTHRSKDSSHLVVYVEKARCVAIFRVYRFYGFCRLLLFSLVIHPLNKYFLIVSLTTFCFWIFVKRITTGR